VGEGLVAKLTVVEMMMERKPPAISVVTPAYKCAGCIDELHRRLVATLDSLNVTYEIIFVDDCSPMNDWEVIRRLCERDSSVRGVKLSRNYGQHFAITAGIDRAMGDWVVVMDCDLQDQPEEIPKLYAKAMEGWSIVLARRGNRQDSVYRKFVSKFFSLIYSWLGDIKTDNTIANFSICSQNVIAAVRRFRERNRSFPMFLNEVGFPRTTIDVEHSSRFHGESAYSFKRLVDFAIQNIVARSNKPLNLSIRFGFILSLVSLFYGTYLIGRFLLLGTSVQGWTSLAVLISFLGGLGFANLGIIGLYVGKVFDEVKGRPLYIVESEIMNKNAVSGLPYR
jgi:glycosyltransferase involved in cell wall biosynthesis